MLCYLDVLAGRINYSPPNRKFAKYSAEKLIGKGSSGQVLLIQQSEHPSLPQQMALKRSYLPIEKDEKIREIKRLEEQMGILMRKEMQHPNLLKHFGWDVQNDTLMDYFLSFSEYCKGIANDCNFYAPR